MKKLMLLVLMIVGYCCYSEQIITSDNWKNIPPFSSNNHNSVQAMTIDSQNNIYMGGYISELVFIDGIWTSNQTEIIAKYNGSGWDFLPDSIYGNIFAMVSDADGNIYIGGNFTTINDVSYNHIAKWNPTTSTWSALGSGIAGQVNALTFDSDGNLYVGGAFISAGGISTNNIAKWNPTTSTWSALSTGLTTGVVYTISCDSSNNVYAGGEFTKAGALTVNYIAKWNGSAWSALGTGINAGTYGKKIYTSAFDSDGNLYVGGSFSKIGDVSASNIAKWDGTSWSALGSGTIGTWVHDIVIDSHDNIFVCGDFTRAGNVDVGGVAEWNGTTWLNIGMDLPDSGIFMLNNTYGNIYVGGNRRIDSTKSNSYMYKCTLNCILNSSVDGNGTIDPIGETIVEYGSSKYFSMEPNVGHHINKILIDGISVGTGSNYTFTNITEDHTIIADFDINIYSVVFNANTNGSINGIKTQSISHGEDCTPVTAVSDPGYHFTNWTGYYTGTDNPLQITNVTSDKSIVANFEHDTATLTLDKTGNGVVGTTSVNPILTSTPITIVATPDANNTFIGWTIDSGSATITNSTATSTTITLAGGNNSTVKIIGNFEEASASTNTLATPIMATTAGTYDDRVISMWKSVPTATTYEIYKNTTNTTPVLSDKITETSDIIFEDTNVVADVSYYYFVKAKNAIKTSKTSIGHIGYIARKPNTQKNVKASDGKFFDKIQISWPKIPGATTYAIYRTETTITPDVAIDTPIGETTSLYFNDFGDDIVPLVGGIRKSYYYWIAAKNANSTTMMQSSNVGYLSNKGPMIVTASKNTYSNKIVVCWKGVTGATAYDIYRYSNYDCTIDETIVGSAISYLEYADTTIAQDITYYYKIKAKYNNNYDSDFNIRPAEGKASSSIIDQISTPINNGDTSSIITNMDKGSILYFSTEVPVGTTRLVAVLNCTSKLITNDCNIVARFANYPTSRIYNAKGIETHSNEILSVNNPSPGTWYFMLYGVTAYTDVTLSVNCYNVTDIILTRVPLNDLSVPNKAIFKGQVIDETGRGIKDIIVKVRNPINGIIQDLRKTNVNGMFIYTTDIVSEGAHTFDFFLNNIDTDIKGTTSYTVTTRKGCQEENSLFDYSRYIHSTPILLVLDADIIGLRSFINTRNGWNTNAIDSTYSTMWINNTSIEAENDIILNGEFKEGLYLAFYGIEGGSIGNNSIANSVFSSTPFIVHVEDSKKSEALNTLNALGIIDNSKKTDIELGSIGIVAISVLSDFDEGIEPSNISLYACEQLELLVKLVSNTNISDISDATYSSKAVKQLAVTLDNMMKLNIITYSYVK